MAAKMKAQAEGGPGPGEPADGLGGREGADGQLVEGESAVDEVQVEGRDAEAEAADAAREHVEPCVAAAERRARVSRGRRP